MVEKAKALLTNNPNLPYLIYHLNACAQNKALDGALKQVMQLRKLFDANFPLLVLYNRLRH